MYFCIACVLAASRNAQDAQEVLICPSLHGNKP
uniref:Uncharacterized protein n=1 Tax=Anguilla anguilla TaxID=7936 RepID=A0A0E9XSC1_ANGAN